MEVKKKKIVICDVMKRVVLGNLLAMCLIKGKMIGYVKKIVIQILSYKYSFNFC